MSDKKQSVGFVLFAERLTMPTFDQDPAVDVPGEGMMYGPFSSKKTFIGTSLNYNNILTAAHYHVIGAVAYQFVRMYCSNTIQQKSALTKEEQKLYAPFIPFEEYVQSVVQERIPEHAKIVDEYSAIPEGKDWGKWSDQLLASYAFKYKNNFKSLVLPTESASIICEDGTKRVLPWFHPHITEVPLFEVAIPGTDENTGDGSLTIVDHSVLSSPSGLLAYWLEIAEMPAF